MSSDSGLQQHLKDDEIVLLMKSEDVSDREKGYSAFVTEYLRPLIALGHRSPLSEHDVEDCVSEFFGALPKHLKYYNPEKGPFQAFIATSFRHHLARKRSVSWKRAAQFPDLASLDEDQLPQAPPARPDFSWLTDLLNSLDSQDRTILTAIYLEDASIEEVSTALNMSSESVRKRLGRARQRLRERLSSLPPELRRTLEHE